METEYTFLLLLRFYFIHASILYKGQGVFEHLWRPNVDGDMLFHETYSRSDALLQQDVDISTSVIELKNFTSRELITGRMLLNKARDTQKNCKKKGGFVRREVFGREWQSKAVGVESLTCPRPTARQHV